MDTPLYQELGLVETVSTKPLFSQKLMSSLANAYQACLQFFTAEPNNEPIITQLESPDGEAYWEIYDPATHQLCYCFSEHELLDLLDMCQLR